MIPEPLNSTQAPSGPITVYDSANSGTVLAVDDDNVSLGLLKDLLTISGYGVEIAHDGDEAISIFSATRFDLVITDIRMPHMDGLDLLRKVKEIDETVQVVLVTGYGDLDYALGALRRGAYDFLLKPINSEILLNTVAKGLELSRLKRLEKDYRRILEEQVKQRTAELAKTNDFLQGIFDSSRGVSIVLTDLEGKIVFWNTGAESIFGYNSEEMVGRDIRILYPEQTYGNEVLKKLGKLMKNGSTSVQENIAQVSKDGRRLTVSVTMSYMSDGSGKLRGILGLGKDVTRQVMLHEEVLESCKRIQRIQGASIFALARLAESRDEETSLHLRRIQAYCRALCANLCHRANYHSLMTQEFIENLVQGSILHDIGKVGLPDAILFNDEKFTPEEFEIMKQHTIKGGVALQEAAYEAGETEGYLIVGKEIAYYHHEHWAGTGYPFGLKGESIPLAARIVTIADVYDALTTSRRYKKAFSHDEARDIILGEKARQFDPELVETFVEIQDEFRNIRDTFSRLSAS